MSAALGTPNFPTFQMRPSRDGKRGVVSPPTFPLPPVRVAASRSVCPRRRRRPHPSQILRIVGFASSWPPNALDQISDRSKPRASRFVRTNFVRTNRLGKISETVQVFSKSGNNPLPARPVLRNILRIPHTRENPPTAAAVALPKMVSPEVVYEK